jgi:flagellar motility protein MotE (MotC chaperone)
MSFWLKKILYSLRVLPILFTVIIALISIRLLLVFTGLINTHDVLPIGAALAAAKEDKASSLPQDKNDKKPDSKEGSEAKQKDEQKSEAGQKAPIDEKSKVDSSQQKEPGVVVQDDKSKISAGSDQKEDVNDLTDEIDDDFSPQKIELLQKLKERNDLLLKSEQKLLERNEILKTVEHKIEEKYKELDQKRLDLEKIKNNLSEINKKIVEEDEKKLQRLVKIYQTMKPKDAARIFDKLDMVVLLEVISRMKEGNTAPIMANMSAERAQNVTMFLAQKRKTVKTED